MSPWGEWGLRGELLLKIECVSWLLIDFPSTRTGLGVYISRIEENSVAERAGLRPGDTILEVNGTPFTSINHEEALKVSISFAIFFEYLNLFLNIYSILCSS